MTVEQICEVKENEAMTAISAAEPPEVALQVSNLNREIAYLKGVCARIEEKIRPVLSPDRMELAQDTGSREREMLAPLAKELQSCGNEVFQLWRQLERLVERIEL